MFNFILDPKSETKKSLEQRKETQLLTIHHHTNKFSTLRIMMLFNIGKI